MFGRFNGFENMCFDVDSYGVSDAMRKVPPRVRFQAASAPEKRSASRHYDEVAAEMRDDAVRARAVLKDTYGLQKDLAAAAMAGKLMFFDFPDLSHEKAVYRAAAGPYEEGMKTVTRLFNESETYRQQASQLRWSARKQEIAGFVRKVLQEPEL